MAQEIIKCEESLLRAMKNSDVKVLDELIHNDLIFNIPTGDIVTKNMDLDTYKSETVLENVDCLDRKVQIFENTAIVSTIIYMKGTYGGMNIDTKIRFFRTWKKFGEQWKIIGGSSIPIN